MTAADGHHLSIDISTRYRDAVSRFWPVHTDPQPEELLSSWLHRLAVANGIAPRAFDRILWSRAEAGLWSASLDLKLAASVMDFLHVHAGVSRRKLMAMSLTQSPFELLLLPLRVNAHRSRSTWMQYCSDCLIEDEQPYFRRHWRLATRISCSAHGGGLRDRCRSCGKRIFASSQSRLIPQYICAHCGFDLRQSPKVFVSVAARRLERCIDDIRRLEAVTRRSTANRLFETLRHMPAAASRGTASTLTSLSASKRRFCFERLAQSPCTWMTNDADPVVTHWRRLILAAGGYGALMAQLTKALEQGRLDRAGSLRHRPAAELPALLSAYLRVMGRSPRRPHRNR